MRESDFFNNGWCRFPYSEALAEWVASALPAARACVDDPRHRQWWRCGDTWFVGVHALDNDSYGALAGGPALAGPAVNFVKDALMPDGGWDRAQVSVCYPGYPQPMAGESAAAFRYRREKAAAHVDGIVPEGPGRCRHLRHHHAFILGLPMVEASPDASPFTVWEGSHELVRDALRDRLGGLPSEEWGDEDITDVYQAARRHVFDVCRPVEISARPGEAYLVHRLALHGIAPWGKQAVAGRDGRMICYFRPEFGSAANWLSER
jgi:hypothetical protein